MKTLAEFDTLELAKEYFYKTYRKIGGNEARQLFSLAGVMDAIEAAQSDTTPCINIEAGINTTVGQLAKAVVATVNNGQFATDPTLEDGKLNRVASSFLVANGVYSEQVEAVFFGRAEDVLYPYANATQHTFLKAKGTCPTKKVISNEGYLKITLTQDVEAHRPSVHAIIDGVVTYITTFSEVSVAKSYNCQVPRGYTELYVDNAYGAIA